MPVIIDEFEIVTGPAQSNRTTADDPQPSRQSQDATRPAPPPRPEDIARIERWLEWRMQRIWAD